MLYAQAKDNLRSLTARLFQDPNFRTANKCLKESFSNPRFFANALPTIAFGDCCYVSRILPLCNLPLHLKSLRPMEHFRAPPRTLSLLFDADSTELLWQAPSE